MEFFLMPSYLFLSLSEEGLLSFYIAKSKEKGEGETCSQPGAELLRAPPPLGRASGEAPGEAPGEAGQGHQCNQGPNEHQLAPNPGTDKQPGSAPGAGLKQKLLHRDTECM